MKIIKYVLLLLLILVIGFSIYIAVQPNSFQVTRSKTINAPQQVIYNNVIDFKNWEDWNSWIKEKPEMIVTLAEQTKGIGGSYSWKDDDGVGTIKTIDTKPNASITQEMQFGTYPKSDVNWQFKSNEDGTTDVTWTISGKDLPFDFKMISAFMGGMEKQIGPHFENGLSMLDSVIQNDMKKYSIKHEGITQHSGGYYLYNTTSSKFSDFEKNMTTMLPKVGAYAMTHNVTMAGPPFILYHKWDEENNAVIFSCCVPTNSKIISNDENILTGKLESFKAVKSVLKGDYSNLKEAWETTMNYIADHNLVMVEGGARLETYLTDPMNEPNPANWVTEIYVEIE
ncbi:SRPBCC family protein [Winogradskyella bathintestinalis]|uniref:GyrI-like domain-containing protein n=1 Tax=Winogradskyella bathintestinalis TaxID=3035208 RepID=A0ABT7ZWV7_9FLAO|nr:GyrI-like domain-containing protein [Winogradskyella bathintestinalis]MDN3493491.1 GyrI-like domain-containing protein [Winogradskyella bathintestinalis]